MHAHAQRTLGKLLAVLTVLFWVGSIGLGDGSAIRIRSGPTLAGAYVVLGLFFCVAPAIALWLLSALPHFPPGHCRNCGYDLTGNVSGRCPECGSEVAPKAQGKTG